MDKNAAEILKHIADKLDIPVEHLWSGLIAYAPFVFWQWVVGIAFGMLIAALLAALGWYALKKGEGEPVLACFAFSLGAFGITAGVGLSHMPDSLSAKFAPQAWASKQIINKFDR